MTKVRMLTKISGTRDGEDWPEIGEVIDVPQAEADQFLLNRQAALASDKEAKLEAAIINHEVEAAVVTAKELKAEEKKSDAQKIHEAPKPAAQIGDVSVPGAGLTTASVSPKK